MKKFENYTINVDHYSLKNGQDEIFLEPRLIKMLAVLSRHAHEVVTREEILAFVWNDTIVNDESISRAVFDLRKALDQNFTNPPKIETIRKVGYRMVQNVAPNRKHKIIRTIGKVLLYVGAVVGFLIILIRAMRY